MLQIDPLILLLSIQALIIFAGLSVFFILKCRNLSGIIAKAQHELHVLHREADKQLRANGELLTWKDKFIKLQEKFETIRIVNEKLKHSLAALIPEAERTKEYEELIIAIEQNNQNLDNCIGSLQKEKAELEKTAAALEREADGLADLLQKSVRKEELHRALDQKQSLKLKHEKVLAELNQLQTEHEKLRQDYIALQKEYNALYKNIEEAKVPAN